MEISIRRASLADAEALSAIGKQTFYDTFTGTCTEEDMAGFLAATFNIHQVIAELQNETDFFYLAEAGGIVIGYARFMEDYTHFPEVKKWKSLELKRIYVSKEFQGRGVAQQLMDVVLDYAIAQQYEVIWLGVWEHNRRAQQFYEKYGFVYSGFTHDFPIGDTPQTDRWLWKML